MPTTGFAWLDRPRRTVVREVPALAVLLVGSALWAVLGEDIQPWDETSYLATGQGMLSNPRLGFSWGPVYSDVYLALSRLVTDPINLYFAGRATAAVFLVLGIWIAVRVHCRPQIAWAAAAVVCLLPVTYTWPGVGGPSAAFALVSVSVALKWPTPAGLGIASALLWFAAGMRPELIWLAIAMTAWATVWLMATLLRRSGVHRASVIAGLLVALGIPLTLIAAHGSPIVPLDRSWIAFVQHYPIHVSSFTTMGDYERIAAETFPNASSISQAFVVNPGAMVRHIAANAASAPSLLLAQILEPTLRPDPIILMMQVAPVVLLLGTAVTAFFAARRHGFSTQIGRVRAWLRQRAAGVVFIVIVTVWAAIPLIVIYPRSHYLPYFAVLGVFLLSLLVGKLPDRRVASWLVVTPLVLIALTFIGQVTMSTIAQKTTSSAPRAAALKEVAALGPVNYLTDADGAAFTAYAPNLRVIKTPIGNATSIADFIQTADIRLVRLTPYLANGEWGKLPGFDEFLNDPSSMGFSPVADGTEFWARVG